MAEHYDAVVIGGGPAGSITAILLARIGWRTALIERRPVGTAKTCGHCLSTRAIPMLASIGLENLIREVAVGATDIMLAHTPSAGDRHAAFPAPALITPRDRLDHRLIGEARSCGASVFQPASARIVRTGVNQRYSEITIRRTSSRETSDRTIRASLVIGADGLRSRVARAFNLHNPRAPGRKFGFSMRCHSPAAADFREDAIHMFITPRGYLGVVRESESTLHCAALVQSAGGEHCRDPRTFFSAMMRSFPLLRHLENAPSPMIAAGPMPDRPACIAIDGAALVGDAAGYVEPFTGEGMTWAIESAIALADVCGSISPGWWTAHEAVQYEAHYRRRIVRRQRFCRLICRGIERPWVWQPLLRGGAISSFLGRHAAARLQPA